MIDQRLNPLYVQIAKKLHQGVAKTEPHQEMDYKLIRKPDQVLVKFWWSESPFDIAQDLKIPVLSFRKGEFNQEYIFLDDLVFNQPIRRDIVHRVNHWSLMFDKKTYHRTKKPYDVEASGKKVRP